MADESIKCRFMLNDPLQSTEPQAIGLDTVQKFPYQLREQWYEAIIEHNISASNEGGHSYQTFILDPSGGIEVKYEGLGSDTATLSADYMALSAALAALGGNEEMARLNPAEAIEVLRRTRLLGEPISLATMLAFNSFVLAASIHQSIHHHAAAVFERMKDIFAWIRANPARTAAIMGGITVFALACATPAILGAVGFSAIGPVAGSAAAAWQASMGSVVAGTLFAFLQSAAMGGAALGLFTGIGAAGAVVAVAAGVASPERVGEVVKTVRNFMDGVVNEVAQKVKGFFGWWSEKRD